MKLINSNPDDESKFLREKLQSTELYCLEIEEQLEKLKIANSESEAKFNGAVNELRVFLSFIFLSSYFFFFYYLRWHHAAAGPYRERKKNLVRNTQTRKKIVQNRA